MSRKAAVLERDLVCPVDGAPLEKVSEGDVTLDRCVQCRGTWCDAEELASVGGDAELEEAARRLAGVAALSRFGCPRCWGECLQVRIGTVLVDTCTSCHGVWLDAGEIEAARLALDELRRAQSRLTPLQRLMLRLEDAVKL